MTPNRAFVASVVLLVATLAADMFTPLGFAVPVVYLLPVVLGLWTPSPRHAVRVAFLAAVFAMLGGALSPPGGSPAMGIVNRVLALLVIVSTASLVHYARTTADALRETMAAREAAESRLREQAALARLGEMAAVVAHEVKNPLTGINGALQIISNRLPAESRDRKIIADIRARIGSLNDSVSDLLVYARPRVPNRTRVELRAILGETASLVRQDAAAGRVSVEVTGDNPALHVDPAMMREVFLNLVLNAAQAMGGEGTVRVTARNGGSDCRISVADAGPGIPEDIRGKIFEPFFTTRARGTGLGLAIVRRTVEQHDGHVSFECPPSGGTVMTVRLPVA
ncbi:MAG: hypothetical protein FJ102_12750 [Deltaproteobacteria bacterium]|nr:hypothetical protein [Deltaproteobacteria bacterium]